MRTAEKWFGRVVAIGILLNLCFSIPAMFAPDMVLAGLDLPPETSMLWLQNVGMLLLSLCIFYAPSAVAPARYPTHSKLVVLARLIASVFWFILLQRSAPAAVVRPLFFTDLALGVLLALLLNPALPAENRVSLRSAKQALAGLAVWLKSAWPTAWVKAILAVVLTVVILGGYGLWYYLLRAEPDFEAATPQEHFKHGAIGLSTESRLPYYIWQVLPTMFPEKLPGPGGWAPFGFIFEPGQAIPIGFSLRRIGYPALEANCSLCHTGTYRTSPTDTPKVILGGPAHSLDLESFQHFLFDCANDPRFTPANVMNAINQVHHLSWFEGLVYRFLIIPVTKHGLLGQKIAYAWQDSRPTEGRGRVDTFNPTKFNVFHMPDDHTIGTVDLPQIWNQRPRANLWLHWDGNNNKLEERNYAAAMAVGATPRSVIPASFKEVTDFLLDLKPPTFPFPVDQPKSARGKIVYDRECASCHAFGSPRNGQLTSIDAFGTDRRRLDSFTQELVDRFHDIDSPPLKFDAYRKTNGYSNMPLDGCWARAPYLHNGSVPTLWDLLERADKRPSVFYTGYDVYDPKHVGFVTSGPEAERSGFKFEVCVPGNSNVGHTYGTELKDDEQWDLIEYLKKL
jgi:mono/diheme cytochrome c family protein